MNTIPDDIDFDAFLAGPDEGASVRPASDWVDQVISAFVVCQDGCHVT